MDAILVPALVLAGAVVAFVAVMAFRGMLAAFSPGALHMRCAHCGRSMRLPTLADDCPLCRHAALRLLFDAPGRWHLRAH